MGHIQTRTSAPFFYDIDDMQSCRDHQAPCPGELDTSFGASNIESTISGASAKIWLIS